MEKEYDLTTKKGIIEYFESESTRYGYNSDVYPGLSDEFRDDGDILLAALEGTGYWAEYIVSHASERLQQDPKIIEALEIERNREYQVNNGYDIHGFDRDGFDGDGFDINGFDAEGYDWRGFNIEGINKETGTRYDKYGFDVDRIHKNGTEFDEKGFDFEGFDKEGFDKFGYDHHGFNRDKTEQCLDGRESLIRFNRNGRIYDEKDYVSIRDMKTGEERRVSIQEREHNAGTIVYSAEPKGGEKTTISSMLGATRTGELKAFLAEVEKEQTHKPDNRSIDEDK